MTVGELKKQLGEDDNKEVSIGIFFGSGMTNSNIVYRNPTIPSTYGWYEY